MDYTRALIVEPIKTRKALCFIYKKGVKNVQLVGQAIKHKVFGKGIVTGRDNNILTVDFSAGEKRFLFPDSFSSFLSLQDGGLQNEIQALLQEKHAKQHAKQQQIAKEKARRDYLRSLKIVPNSQAVFNLKKEEIAKTFADWSVCTGYYLSGYSKGKPRTLDRLAPNSICVLTHCKNGMIEQDRRIIGAFMVPEDFLGSECEDGIIPAHEIYRMKLAPKDELLFWPYLQETPPTKAWGSVAFRYLSNITAAKILFDMKEAVRGTGEQEHAEQFYEHFCKINKLNLSF